MCYETICLWVVTLLQWLGLHAQAGGLQDINFMYWACGVIHTSGTISPVAAILMTAGLPLRLTRSSPLASMKAIASSTRDVSNLTKCRRPARQTAQEVCCL